MDKKEIKINFKYFWEGFDPENNFFTNLLRKKYKVTISDNPDFLFYSVYPEIKANPNFSKKGDFIKKISPRLYIFLRKIYPRFRFFLKGKSSRPVPPKGSYVRIFFGAENVKPNMNECGWAFSSELEEEFKNPRHMRLPIYVVNDFALGKKAMPPVKRKIDFEKIKKEKKNFCNFIYSQDIEFRNNFFKKLNKYKKVDSPGRCMTNMPPIGSHKDAKNSRMFNRWVEEKLDFIKGYKFTIAFENSSVPRWTTEKLTHPMLVNSIPIYFGHPSVAEEFNTKSFINYHDFETVEDFINHIIKVDKDDELYKKYLKEPFYKRGFEKKYFDEKRYLERFKEIFG